MAEPRELSFRRDEAQALEVRLAGSWTKSEGLPSVDELRRAIELPAPASRLAFDARGVLRWDSALVAVVDRLVELARERSVPVALDGLPAGVVRLVALADAVPERAGAAAPSRSPGVVARIGGAALALWDDVAEFVPLRIDGQAGSECSCPMDAVFIRVERRLPGSPQSVAFNLR